VVRDIDGDGELEAVFMDDDRVWVLKASDGTVKDSYTHGQLGGGYGTQAVFDVDKDGVIETLCGYTPVLCLLPDMTLKWSYDPAGYICNAPIAVYDLDGDGELEIIMSGAGADDTYCLSPDGTEKWVNTVHGGYSAVAIADIDGDGVTEVLTGCDGNDLACLRGTDGAEKWSLSTWGDPRTPALYDIDGDGKLEILVSDNTYLYCIDHDGTLLWQKTADDVYGCPVVVADIDGDGEIECVAVRDARSGVVCYRASDGFLKWDYNAGVTYVHGPVACDIDGDGTIEIIFGADDDYVYCLNPDGTLKWRHFTATASLMYKNAPCLACVDDDGKLEILVGNDLVHCIDKA